MKSPCHKCVVSSMCEDPCWALKNYIDIKVADSSHIKDFKCGKYFLNILSEMIREKRTFIHKIMIDNIFYTMTVNNTDIIVRPSFKRDRFWN